MFSELARLEVRAAAKTVVAGCWSMSSLTGTFIFAYVTWSVWCLPRAFLINIFETAVPNLVTFSYLVVA